MALVDRPDVAAVVVVSDDGLVVESHLPDRHDAEELAALATSAGRAVTALGQAARSGPFVQAAMEYGDGTLILQRLPSSATLLVLSPPMVAISARCCMTCAAMRRRWCPCCERVLTDAMGNSASRRVRYQVLAAVLAVSAETAAAAAGPRSSAEDAVDRLAGFIPAERILVVSGGSLAERLRDRLALPHDNFLLEPRAASTGPALVWGDAGGSASRSAGDGGLDARRLDRA